MLTGKDGRGKLAEGGPADSLPDKGGATPAGGSEGRLNGDDRSCGILFPETNFGIVDALREIACEVGRSMAEVASA